MIRRVLYALLMLLRVICWLRGGHRYDERWTRVVRADGSVELRQHHTCTRCPTGGEHIRRRVEE